jgi:hypothetical protein
MATTAESKLERSRYYGEKRRHTFEDFVQDQKDQHQLLSNMAEKGLHAGIDMRSQVRHLVAGIRTNKLDVVKGQILANPAMRNDFDSCVTLYQDFISQAAQHGNPTFNVTAIGVQKKERGRGYQGKVHRKRSHEDDGGSDVEDRYYKPEEYSKLNGRKKKKLATMREARGDKKKQPRQSAIKEMGHQIAALEAKFNPPDDKESEGDEATTTNRNHSALTRQRKK